MVSVVYGSERRLKSFYKALSSVAREKVYIEMVEAPQFSTIQEFQRKLIANNYPVYFAIHNNEVVGWADINPSANPRLAHRGSLGMGLIKSYRGQGIGTRLLKSALNHAKRIGLEKVELTVYTSNEPAIALYKKMGFEQEGLIKRYRKLGNRYFDCLTMAHFL